MCGRWRSATSDPTKITSPRCRSTIPGSTAVANRLAPMRWICTCDSNASRLISCNRPKYVSPAPATSSSMSPSSSVARCTNALTESASCRWRATALVTPPAERSWSSSSWHLSTRRAPSATGKPRPANSTAVAAPIPDEAPATSAGLRSGSGAKRGMPSLSPDRYCYRQMGEPADVARMDSDGVGLVDLESADPLEQFGQRDAGFHPGKMRTKTEVGTATETHQLRTDFAPDAVLVGLLEHPVVTVRRAGQQKQDVAFAHRGVVETQLARHGARQDLAGRVVAQRLLDPQRYLGVVVEDRRQLVGVPGTPIRCVGKQLRGGLVACDHHQEQERHDLFVGEAVAVDLGFQ